MATATANGVQLFYEISGQGDIPLVLVHGSWGSHDNWGGVLPVLSRRFKVLTYDRRGHSASERPSGQGSVQEDATDLAALIEHLDLAPAWVAGTSFGGSIVLRLASMRPELFRGLIAHEPPLFSLLDRGSEAAASWAESRRILGTVLERIEGGDHVGGAELFVEEVAIGRGAWNQMPSDLRHTFVQNAPTFLDESRDPDQVAFELTWMEAFDRPCLLTTGDASPPTFGPVAEKLSGAAPMGELVVIPGAGHIPHVTHPDPYVDIVEGFVGRAEGHPDAS